MKLLETIGYNDESIAFNPARIVAIMSRDTEDWTYIVTNNDTYVVKESYNVIINKFEKL